MAACQTKLAGRDKGERLPDTERTRRAGVIQKLNHLDSARYDCQTGPQGHFICEICGEITDFAFPEGALAPAESPCGEVRHIELRLSGVCGKCRQAMTEGKPGKEKQVRIRARKTRK